MSASDVLPSGAVVVPVGSRVTCNPPPTDTDEDYLVLVSDRRQAVEALKHLGFEPSLDPQKLEDYERMNMTAQWEFTSLWFGDVNYIVTESHFFFERFLTATHICKALNLLDKKDRIMVFEAVRGASFSHEVTSQWKPDFDGINLSHKSGSKSSHGLSDRMLEAVSGLLPDSELPF
jgi:hypothetical protein